MPPTQTLRMASRRALARSLSVAPRRRSRGDGRRTPLAYPPALEGLILPALGVGALGPSGRGKRPYLSPSSSHLATAVRHTSITHAKIGTAMESRKTWIAQLIILLITVLVFQRVLEATGPAIAILTGAVTFIVPTIIWTRLNRRGED